MLKDKQRLDKIFIILQQRAKPGRKKANNLKEKWAKDTNRQFGEKETQITQMYEKMFNITHNNRKKIKPVMKFHFSPFR